MEPDLNTVLWCLFILSVLAGYKEGHVAQRGVDVCRVDGGSAIVV